MLFLIHQTKQQQNCSRRLQRWILIQQQQQQRQLQQHSHRSSSPSLSRRHQSSSNVTCMTQVNPKRIIPNCNNRYSASLYNGSQKQIKLRYYHSQQQQYHTELAVTPPISSFPTIIRNNNGTKEVAVIAKKRNMSSNVSRKYLSSSSSSSSSSISSSNINGESAVTTATSHNSAQQQQPPENDDNMVDSSSVIRPFETRMLELVQQTESAMLKTTTVVTDATMKDGGGSFNPTKDVSTILLQRWYVLLQDMIGIDLHNKIEQTTKGRERMQTIMSTSLELMKVLYDYWYRRVQHEMQKNKTKNPLTTITVQDDLNEKLTNIPFIIMLNTYSGCLDPYDSSSSTTNTNGGLLHGGKRTPQPLNEQQQQQQQQVAMQFMHPQLAFQTLQDWDQLLNGHLFLSAQSKYYQMVLRNYAQHSTYCNGNNYRMHIKNIRWQQQQQQQKSSTSVSEQQVDASEMSNDSSSTKELEHTNTIALPNPMNDTEIYPESVVIANEIIEYLKHGYRVHYYDIEGETLPNLQTYQYAIRCITAVTRSHYYAHGYNHSHATKRTTVADHEDTKNDLLKNYERMQLMMDKVLQINRKEHKELNTFLLCLSDAIRTYRYIDIMYLRPHRMQHEQQTSSAVEDAILPTLTKLRRNEWITYWLHFLDVNNTDFFLNLQDIVSMNGETTSSLDDPYHRVNYNSGFAILEQTTYAVLDLLKDDLHAAVSEATKYQNDYSNITDQQQIPVGQQATTTTTMDDCIGTLEKMTQCILKLDDMVKTKGIGLPSGRNYAFVISAWTYLMKRDIYMKYDTIIQQQQSLLLQLVYDHHQRMHSNPKTDIEHDHATESWNFLLQSYINAQQPDKVIELWQMNNENGPGGIRRNQHSYDLLFFAYGTRRLSKNASRNRELAQQAHTMLGNTITYDPEDRSFEPSSKHFASVMVAWSRSHDTNAAMYCQQVFDRMLLESERVRSIYGPLEDITDKSIDTFVPTSTHYNALLISWGYSRSPEAVKRIFDIYQLMKRSGHNIDVNTFSTITYALSRIKSQEAAEQTEHILDIVEGSSFEPNQLEKDTHGTRLESAAEQTDHNTFDQPYHAKKEIYKACMHAWCYSGASNAHAKCTQIFHRLLTAYEKSGYSIDLRPDSAAYAILIDSMTLDSNSDKSVLAIQAEKILEQMEAQAAAGLSEAPMVRVYTAVMKAHYKSEDPDAPFKVENLIRRMNTAYEAGNLNAKPDGHSMTLLLQAWSKSDIPNKASIAWGIHKQMQEAYDRGDTSMKPNSYSLMAILNTCAYTKATEKSVKNETVKVALMALNELDKVTNGYLSDHAFRSIFQVIAYLIDKRADRELHARVIFQRCCEAGHVSDWVIQKLRSHFPSLYVKLPKNADHEPICPKKWSRNVARQTD